jgi:hypothetical protein
MVDGFEGMPKNEDGNVQGVSRAQFELTGKNADPKNLRTFQSDLADTIKSGGASVVKIAMAENARKEALRAERDPRSMRNLFLILGGIILLFIGLGIIAFALIRSAPKTLPLSPVEGSAVPGYVRSERDALVNLTGFSRPGIKEALSTAYANAVPQLGSLTHLILFTTDAAGTKHLMTTEEFFKSIESAAPPTLLRSLNPSFTAVVHGWNQDGLALLFKTDSYETAFTSMISWEDDMFDELYQIFNINTEGTRASLFGKRFIDKVIKNQDSRAIVDSAGKPVLFYTFLGERKDLLVIANTEDILSEIVNRLTASTLRR